MAIGPAGVFVGNVTSEDQGLLRFDKSLGRVTPLTRSISWALATDATHVYFAGGAGLQRIAQSGGAAATVVPSAEPSVIAVDDTSVYWAEVTWSGLEMRTSTCRLFRADKTGGAAVALGQGADRCRPSQLIPMSSGVYFMCQDDLMRAPLDGSAPVVVATIREARGDVDIASDDIASDDTTFYVSLWYAGKIMSVPHAGGEFQTLAEGQDHPVSIVAFAESLYWRDTGWRDTGSVTTVDLGTVKKMPKIGGPPTVLAAAQRHPTWIVVDDTGVYWLNDPPSSWNLSKTPR